MIKEAAIAQTCYHCGESCRSKQETFEDKAFCCNGCKNVYLLLNQNHLDHYYCLNETPGYTVQESSGDKFRFLDDQDIASRLLTFRNEEQSRVCFYLPQIHCSSCLWLLENLQKMNSGIIVSQVNFTRKEIAIAFNHHQINLRALAELLASIGYEPHINLADEEKEEKQPYSSKKAAYKLGITGFCFANIMLISFPEYLGMHAASDPRLAQFFRIVNLLLVLPVVGYGAREFFQNAWYSFRQKYVNIDAPIALAIAVTFGRSVYEILTQTGSGYLDSMSGIVFFMLLGRTLQNRAYSTLKFNRDYKSYFPVAVVALREGEETICPIQDIQKDDILLLHHGEIVPTDCLLTRGKAQLDYSFVTGESQTEQAAIGDIIYAGARVVGAGIEVISIKPFSQNSFTRLWNNKAFSKKKEDKNSLVTLISKYFSIVVFSIATLAFFYWYPAHPHNAWNALTAVLIVACPCALLLTSTFTNGYLIDYLSQHGFFIKNADVIERLAKINSITFDKTGTITNAGNYDITASEITWTETDKETVLSALSQSLHPLSKAIVDHFNYKADRRALKYQEYPGKGIEVKSGNNVYRIGNSLFATGRESAVSQGKSEVWISKNGTVKAHFLLKHNLKDGVLDLMPQLSHFHVSLLSGDHEGSRNEMQKLLGKDSELLFRQSPEQKLAYIQQLQDQGHNVMMIGDGLNDAGALRQSDVGVAVVQNSFSFSPASDIIMTSSRLRYLVKYIRVAQSAQRLIFIGFIYSLLFNIIGICFAVTANLSPMIAAILMPSSSLGIMLIAYAGITMASKRLLR